MVKSMKVPGRMASSGGDMPPTEKDRVLSIQHAKDSVKFNLKHAKDHMKAAKKAKSRLMRVQRVRVRAV